MTSQRRLFWGLFFITLGVLFLARNWGIFPLPDWQFVRGLWPVLLILAGVAMILRRTDTATSRSAVSIVATTVLAVALPFFLFSFVTRDRWNWRNHDDDDYSFRIDPPEPPEAPEAPDAPDMDDDDDDDNVDFDGKKIVGTFVEDMPTPAPTEAKLVLESGLTGLRLEDGTPKLIDARSEAIMPYSMSIDRAGNVPTIRLSPAKNAGDNINIDLSDDDDRKNVNVGKVTVKLNEAPLWSMDIDLGVSGGDFDLRRYAIKSLDIDAGMSGLDLRLGDKAAACDVKISSGMASVKVRVPKGAGVKIITDGGLNATDIDNDFEKVGNNTYLSPGYETSAKKITIHYDGGLSHFEVDRE